MATIMEYAVNEELNQMQLSQCMWLKEGGSLHPAGRSLKAFQLEVDSILFLLGPSSDDQKATSQIVQLRSILK